MLHCKAKDNRWGSGLGKSYLNNSTSFQKIQGRSYHRLTMLSACGQRKMVRSPAIILLFLYKIQKSSPCFKYLLSAALGIHLRSTFVIQRFVLKLPGRTCSVCHACHEGGRKACPVCCEQGRREVDRVACPEFVEWSLVEVVK